MSVWVLLCSSLIAAACDSGNSIDNPIPADNTTASLAPIDENSAIGPITEPQNVTPPVMPANPTSDGGITGSRSDIVDGTQVYASDGYASVDVIRVDLVTRTVAGVCIEGDQSGCTLDDVLSDTNSRDNFKVDIPVHFRATDYADDGLINNAELRQRGGGTRVAPQKSFRIKLDDKDRLWRGERHLQLNKHPFDNTRIRNKLSFDLINTVPHLPGFRTQFINLWIDDGQGPVDYGLYTHVERGDQRYLNRRGLDSDGRLYKAELFRFRAKDRDSLLIDADGEPLNVDAFETVLEVENGKDHRNLLAMLDALHDPEQSFEAVMDRYFNENNVLAWLALNLLLGQQDAIRHNYFLYSPEDSETFYFLPWDYDFTFEMHTEPPNAMTSEALKARQIFGYALGSENEFIERFYRLPGTHEKLLSVAAELRNHQLNDVTISERAALLATTAAPFASRSPDITHNTNYYAESSADFASKVAFNHSAMMNMFSIPMPPTLADPERVGQNYRFSWIRAHELTGHDLTYDLQLASSPAFTADSIVYSATGIADSFEHARDVVTHEVAAVQLASGIYYARLVARSVREPARYWQVADNKLELDGNIHYGVVRFFAD